MSELILWKDQEMTKLRKDMQRIFNRFWYDFGVPILPDEIAEPVSIDLSETEDTLIIKAKLPGIHPKDMGISVTGDTVIVKGETTEEKIEETARYHRVERRAGSFSRTIPLPCRVKVDEIEAIYKDGVLKITMPKCEPDETRGVEIKVK